MRRIVTSIVLGVLCLGTINAQDSESAKQTIIDFFEAFHQQDSTKLRSYVSDGIIMQSIGQDKDGNTQLSTTDFDKFVKSITSIPKDNSFEEKLLDFSIKVDGQMANVWTPYEFWYNDNFSHCGVNSFQLLKKEGEWKIIYLVDTRRREGCSKP